MKYTGERFIPTECTDEMAIEHYQRYQFAQNVAVDKVVLDAACGEGYGTYLLSHKASMAIGIDIDSSTIDSAQKRYQKENIQFVTGSIGSLPFEDHTFDIVVSFETIEHVDEKLQNAFMNEITRVLKRQGVLIMSTPNKAIYTDLVHGENIHHVKEFYTEEYEYFLARYFKYKTFYYQSPLVGYFITSGLESRTVHTDKMTAEESRYIIAVCSNAMENILISDETIAKFDNGMYYFLCRRSHDLERELLKTKQEAETFSASLEESIVQQKKYIDHLQHDIECLKGEIAISQSTNHEYVSHLENDIATLKEKNNDQQDIIDTQEKYIQHLEQDIKRLEKDMAVSKTASDEYAAHLEQDIKQLEKDLAASRTASDEYIAHLEHDIAVLKGEKV